MKFDRSVQILIMVTVLYPNSSINQERHALFYNFALKACLKTHTITESNNPADSAHNVNFTGVFTMLLVLYNHL